jgi:hypothetical protein
MNDALLVIGILLAVPGAILVAMTLLYPESVRRENRRVRSLTRGARDAGLRGRYKFERDRSKWDSTGEFGTYEPADGEDRVLYAAVGPKLEGESAFFAKEMLWTDKRFAWLGIPLLVIGVAICVLSFLS